MRLLLKISFFLAVAFSISCAFAQSYPSVHFTIKNGLPSNGVYCIFKDSRGYIWIGTDAGLVKYDGFQFQVFTKKNGLIGNFIRDIKEDKKGNLWIACYGDGLTKFDGIKFNNYSTKNGLVNNEIRCLYFDRFDNLCIGTERGLSIWNGKRFVNFLTKSLDKYNRFQVMQFWEEKGHLYFLSRTHGYFEIRKENDNYKFVCFGKSSSQILFVRLKKEKIYSFTDGLFSDKTNDQFPLNFKKHEQISSDVVWDYEKINQEYYLASNCVFCNNGGLLKYNNANLSNVSDQFNIHSKQVWNLYFDKKETKLWVTTLDNGIYVLDIKPKIIFHKLFDFRSLSDKNEKIRCSKNYIQWRKSKLKIDADDFIEFGKKNANRYLIENSLVIKSKSLIFNKQIVNNFLEQTFDIRTIKVYHNKIYVSTNIGFFELTIKGQFLSYFPIDANLFQIRSNDILLSQLNGNIHYLKKANDKWLLSNLPLNGENEPKEINDLVHLNDKTYFSSSLYGLYAIADNSLIAKRFGISMFKNLKIRHISSDTKNHLFVATTDNEVLVFKDVEGKLVFSRKITTKNFTGETILQMEFANNVLILLTNRGLNLIANEKSIFLDEEQGLNLSNVTNMLVEGNKLIIGTNSGYYELLLSDFLSSEKDAEMVSIKSVEILGKTLENKKALFQFFRKKNVHLKHNENNIKVQLNKIDLYHGKKSEFSYSFNKQDWIPIYGNNINLSNLESGNYDLFIRQKNRFSGNSKTFQLLSISVAKPFWSSFWFVTILIILFLISVFLLFRLNVNRVKKREQQKSELLKRIAENKLEALQSQMNPHFIFNSLSAIHSFIIKSDVDNALLYMDKFSKLTRQTLEFSSRMQITLLEELEYLSHFIALENMRFGDRVDVKIDAGELDTIKILIPPLLIQPMVENAFEHGFTNRDKNYSLELTFEIEEEQLQIIISDDGEGFSSNETKPESKAMKIIRERLQLIDPKLVEFFTLTREDNRTVVRFMLPLITR